ncbi:IMS domain-containing protein [Tumidithrix elongata RA019]|uniref:non-specific serine/threonine protein kinase n=1 Tax=Tumidithrix elongata BACA0141 TaxID=2716417 RepID=A0AAW9Q5C1_9CYAN|nr:IMS domain-containing protein [Tumidithrix elongata RA019]
MIGQLLDRRYRIVRSLGSGGFGRTYLAQDLRIPGEPVCVVKHLKPVSTDPAYLQIASRLFTGEATTLAKLGHHDQIPRLLAYFEENQEFYLVEEFIEGHSLNDEIQTGRTYTEAEAVQVLMDVLEVLAYVHSQGVIHRDIKPDNLIRRQSDRKLILIDFGAIKQVQSQLIVQQGQISATVAIGTPGYMSSEQGQGKPRPSSDLFALGMIGIQILTGLSPRKIPEDKQTGELSWQHLVAAQTGLVEVLTKMTRYHYKDRYETATEVLQVLRQVTSPYLPTQPPIQPPIPSPIQPSAQPLSQQVTQSALESTYILPQPIPPVVSAPQPQPLPLPAQTSDPDPTASQAPTQQVPNLIPQPFLQPTQETRSQGGKKGLLIGLWVGAMLSAIAVGVLFATRGNQQAIAPTPTAPVKTTPIAELPSSKPSPTATTTLTPTPTPERSNPTIEPTNTPVVVTPTAVPTNPSKDAGTPQVLTEAKAVSRIRELVSAKRQMFAPPFDRARLAELTTGDAYEKRSGSIDWLQNNNAYYEFGAFAVKPTGEFQRQGDRALVTVEIVEAPTLYVNGQIDRSQSLPSQGKYRCELRFENGTWKISNLIKLD